MQVSLSPSTRPGMLWPTMVVPSRLAAERLTNAWSAHVSTLHFSHLAAGLNLCLPSAFHNATAVHSIESQTERDTRTLFTTCEGLKDADPSNRLGMIITLRAAANLVDYRTGRDQNGSFGFAVFKTAIDKEVAWAKLNSYKNTGFGVSRLRSDSPAPGSSMGSAAPRKHDAEKPAWGVGKDLWSALLKPARPSSPPNGWSAPGFPPLPSLPLNTSSIPPGGHQVVPQAQTENMETLIKAVKALTDQVASLSGDLNSLRQSVKDIISDKKAQEVRARSCLARAPLPEIPDNLSETSATSATEAAEEGFDDTTVVSQEDVLLAKEAVEKFATIRKGMEVNMLNWRRTVCSQIKEKNGELTGWRHEREFPLPARAAALLDMAIAHLDTVRTLMYSKASVSDQAAGLTLIDDVFCQWYKVYEELGGDTDLVFVTGNGS